jgi:hypothetical protein
MKNINYEIMNHTDDPMIIIWQNNIKFQQQQRSSSDNNAGLYTIIHYSMHYFIIHSYKLYFLRSYYFLTSSRLLP